ncbi:hypothetical protein [Methylobacterium aquaticum]|uniref:hypothetical protein n=1 Tax=Methylobacterium aquaticum TaxID=270351 RepID=UPI0019343860|nr:hypothetical protein [Methylobacterium aquaticum]
MPNATVLRNLFDRRERVRREGAVDLVEACVVPHHVRHDGTGDRTVARGVHGSNCLPRPGL